MLNIIIFSLFIFSADAWSFGGGRQPDRNPGSDLNAEDRRWKKLLEDHGGRYKDANRYADNAGGFDQYLADSGISDYDANDLIVPHNRGAANRCGLSDLLPPQSDWLKGAAIAKWTEAAADVAGGIPYVRNWYRPTCYNSAVGGASGSDHIQARAFDMDFRTTSQRRRAQDWLCRYWDSSLNMQIGLGGVSIHLGAESPRGKRNWYYGSYRDSDRGRTCFDR